MEVDIGRDDVSADVKRDNLGCLSLLTNISYKIGNLWRSAKNEYIKQLENNVTKALNKLAYDISSEREELVARMIPLLVTDEETARKYVTTVIEKARFESLIELLKEEISCREKILKKDEDFLKENESIDENLNTQVDNHHEILTKMEGEINNFKKKIDEENNTLEQLKKDNSLFESPEVYKVIKDFILNVIKLKTVVVLGYISYGQEFTRISSAYTRGAVQLRLVIPYEGVLGLISHHEKPEKLSPDIYFNTEVGIKASFPILRELANIDEKKVNLSTGTGLMIRDRIGIGCTLEYNPIIKKYEFDTQQGFKLVHEQLVRGRVNLSLLGSEVRAGVQGSVYASISVSKAVYSTDDEKLKIFANLGVTGVNAALCGSLAYFLFPPDVATTVGAAVAGQVLGGYMAAKIPKIAPNKQTTQSMEVNNAGVALGVPVQTGFGGGLVFRGSGKIPILSRVPKATAPQSQAGEMQVRRRDAAPENSQ
ncbi:hypothetical protein ASE93_06030 [Serratia sp. Leaf50]|nr:hypothetical protein ASE93_06030 [Serratia sp. Leaf50]